MRRLIAVAVTAAWLTGLAPVAAHATAASASSKPAVASAAHTSARSVPVHRHVAAPGIGAPPAPARTQVSADGSSGDIVAAWQQQQALTTTGGTWSSLGPTVIANSGSAGRVLALARTAPDSTALVGTGNPLYLGSADGGVWKSTNGTSWTPLTDGLPVLAINAIAVDPLNPNIIYAGSGEVARAYDSISGAGIYRSVDAGANWTLVAPSLARYSISKIIIDSRTSLSTGGQTASAYVYAGVTSFGSTANAGVARSTDGGLTWTVGYGLAGKSVTDLALDNTAGAVYAAVGDNQSASNGVYRAARDSSNFLNLIGTSFTTPTNTYRWRIALATPDASLTAQKLYAVAGDARAGATNGLVYQVYESLNGGGAWTDISGNVATLDAVLASGSCLCQAWYDLEIAVDPGNSDHVFVETTDVYERTSGSTWADITNVYGGQTGLTPSANIHPDQHAILFAGSNIYWGNDGGVYRSGNPIVAGGNPLVDQFGPVNSGLALAQFYGGSVPSNPTVGPEYFGGLQDNGNVLTTNNGAAWNDVTGGDGFYTANSSNGTHLYAEYASGAFEYSFDSGVTFPYVGDVSVPPGVPGTEIQQFGTPLMLDPNAPSDDVYLGYQSLWHQAPGVGNFAAPFTQVITPYTGTSSTLLTFAFARTPGYIYIAGNDRHLYVKTAPNNPWLPADGVVSPPCAGAGLSSPTTCAAGKVRSISVNPMLPATVYAATDGYSNGSGGHVFMSTNSGAAWTDISGSLPNVPFRSVLVDPDSPTTIYAGSQLGVYVSKDSGVTWSQLGSGLPNASVYGLVKNAGSSLLYAFTHGRSAWKIDTAGPPPVHLVVSGTTAETAGTPFTFTVTAQDAGNAAFPAYAGTIQLSSDDAQGTFPPSGSTATYTFNPAVDSGSHTFTANLKTAGTKTITATDQGTSAPAAAGSKAFTVSPDAPNRLAFGQQPADTVAGAVINPAVAVNILDQWGNQTTSTATVALARQGGTGTLSGTTSRAAVSGTATFNDLVLTAAGAKTLQATSGILASATSASFMISPAAPTVLAFVQQPSDVAEGSAIAPAVTVQLTDAYGNNSTTTSQVTMAINTGSPGTLGGTTGVAPNSGGLATFSGIYVQGAGGVGSYTLRATLGGSSATSNSFNVTPGPPKATVITAQPTDTTAGTTISAVSVKAVDQFGNTVTGLSTGTVRAAIGSGAGAFTSGSTTSVSWSAGTATFSNLEIDTAGPHTLALSTDATGVSPVTSASFSIRPGAASKLAFGTQPTDTDAGSAIPDFKVSVLDQWDNLVTNSTATIALSVASGGGSVSPSTAVNADGTTGSATFSGYVIIRAGPHSLSATSGSLLGAVSATFTIRPLAPTHLGMVQQPPTTAVAGAVFSPAVAVELLDTYGNRTGVGAHKAHVTSSPATAGLFPAEPAGGWPSTNGLIVVTDLFATRVGSYTLAVTDATDATVSQVNSSSFSITPGPDGQLVFPSPITTPDTAGTAIPDFAVQVNDQYGNRTSSTRSVTLSVQETTASIAGGNPTVNAVNGVATFSGVSIRTAGTFHLLADSTGVTKGASTPFSINPAAEDHLVATATATNGRVDVLVQAVDAYGNVTPSTDSVQVSSAPDGTPSSLTQTLSNGSSTFTFRYTSPGTKTFSVSNQTRPGVAYTGPALNASVTSVSATFYFAEGATIGGIQETLYLLSPRVAGTAHITYYLSNGTAITRDIGLTAGVVRPVSVNDSNEGVGPNQSVSIKVVMPGEGVAERVMNFNVNGWHGSTDQVGVPAANTEWDFAEGSTQSIVNEYLTIQNPNNGTVRATLNYLTSGQGLITKYVDLQPNSRTTIEVFSGDTSSGGVCDPNANCGVGRGIDLAVQVRAGSPIIAERPMYVNGTSVLVPGGGPIRDGHDVFGANAPAALWNFAEGSTQAGITEYLTVGNADSRDSSIAVTYLYPGGAAPLVRYYSVPGRGRITIPVNSEAGAGRDVSVKIEVLNGVNVFAERPMYMYRSFGSGLIAGAHDVVGSPNAGNLVYGFAAATTAAGNSDFLTIENPGSNATLTIRYYTASGQITQTVGAPGGARTTVDITGSIGAGIDPVGITITSDQPVIVEKPTYSVNDSTYGATDATGYSPPGGAF